MLVLGLVLAWTSQEEEVKFSDAFILSMNRTKWAEYHADRVGSSTMAMCDAQILWGDALRRRNDSRLAKTPAKLRKAIPAIRKDLADYREQMVHIGNCFTGGGTMWNPVYAANGARVEETISILLTDGKARRSYVVSTVTKKQSKVAKDIEITKSDLESGKFFDQNAYQGAKSSLAKAEKTFAKIVATAKTQPRRVSDALLEFCADAADIPEDVRYP